MTDEVNLQPSINALVANTSYRVSLQSYSLLFPSLLPLVRI